MWTTPKITKIAVLPEGAKHAEKKEYILEDIDVGRKVNSYEVYEKMMAKERAYETEGSS